MGTWPISFAVEGVVRQVMAKRANHVARGRILVPFPEELLVQADENAIRVESETPGTTRNGAIRRLVEAALRLEVLPENLVAPSNWRTRCH